MNRKVVISLVIVVLVIVLTAGTAVAFIGRVSPAPAAVSDESFDVGQGVSQVATDYPAPGYVRPTRAPRTPTPEPVLNFPPATPYVPRVVYPGPESTGPITTPERAVELGALGARLSIYLRMSTVTGGVARRTTWGEVERLTNQRVYSISKDQDVWLVTLVGKGTLTGPGGDAPSKAGYDYAMVVLDAATGDVMKVHADRKPLWSPWP